MLLQCVGVHYYASWSAGMAEELRLFLAAHPTASYTGVKGVKKLQRIQRSVIRGYNMCATTVPGPGSGVLDRPILDKTTPVRDNKFDLVKQKKTSPPYQVMLHNDNFNKREYVVQVLMKVIPGMTVDTAVNVMQEAHINGLAVVIICPQEDAEEHCLQLRSNGLLSSVEPASGGC